MPEPDLIEIFARPVHDVGVEYFVAGSLACMFYAEPRLTLDIDLPIAVPDAGLARLPVLFASPDFYCPPLDILMHENRRECRGHFNVIHVATGLKADFYPAGADPFHRWAWEHRRRAIYPHGEIYIAPPEYVIVWKVAYYHEGGGEKHLRDLRGLIALAADQIDRAALWTELRRRGLDAACRSMLPGWTPPPDAAM